MDSRAERVWKQSGAMMDKANMEYWCPWIFKFFLKYQLYFNIIYLSNYTLVNQPVVRIRL
jgi:hypothetical protein